MSETNKSTDKRTPLAARIAVVAFALLVAAASLTSSRDPVPGDAVLTMNGWADETSCRECHFEADSYPETGHAQTLRPATDPRSIEILSSVNSDASAADDGLQIDIDPESGVFAVQQDQEISRRIRLDWCFGSGAHAHTWTSTVGDLLGNTDELEFRWTWFHQTDSFALTPGQPEQAGDSHYGAFGLFFDGAKAVGCFSCHTSYLPAENGSIDFHGMVAGINCQRCHGPQQAHVASGGEVIDSDWMATDRLDAVRRCGQCHRNADEQPPGEIRTDNPGIVRFQPVGLLQSPCFIKSEMSCTTCHDPHKSLAAQDSRGIWQCVQCHNPDSPTHTLCAADNRDDCLRCHMPKVATNPNIRFTDHWIRVRDDIEESK
ncbi:multiheme c-type cytochrome [Rosistilla oblonga]|uniref:multiheme c-type cytochrome n=1 Tax=Rosistilla oblonga TaxID=2527990 RepID=UPI003A984270